LNRGILVIAEKAWYNNRTEKLHIIISSDDEGGLADGATTDRVIRNVKRDVSSADFESLAAHEIPEHLRDAFVHVEIISGGIGDMLVPLTRARNTSNKVQEFALENLGGGFDWLKELIEESKFRGKIKFRENDPQPVDVRTVLALLTLFHPKWNQQTKEPVISYTSKGQSSDTTKTKNGGRVLRFSNPLSSTSSNSTSTPTAIFIRCIRNIGVRWTKGRNSASGKKCATPRNRRAFP